MILIYIYLFLCTIVGFIAIVEEYNTVGSITVGEAIKLMLLSYLLIIPAILLFALWVLGIFAILARLKVTKK